jgi:hypothetical protein
MLCRVLHTSSIEFSIVASPLITNNKISDTFATSNIDNISYDAVIKLHLDLYLLYTACIIG